MDQSFIPVPDNIPVHWIWFHVLLLFTFLLHVLLMNLILGGSLLTVWDILKGKKVSSDAKSIPTLIALTVNFGVPPLLFMQVLYGNLFYTSSVLMAVPWILVIPVLIVAYYGAYIFVYKFEKKPKLAKTSLVVTATLLLTIAFIYVNNITLSMSPERFTSYFENAKGWTFNLQEPSLIPRYLHYIVASVAIAGLGKATWYYFSKNIDPAEKQVKVNKGLKIFSYATMVQVIIGVLFWFSLPSDIGRLLIGGNISFSLLFGLGIILAFLIIMLSSRRNYMATLLTVIPLLAIMILIRDFIRRAYISDVFSPAQLENAGQPDSLVLFLLVFVAGLGSIAYMLRIMFVQPKTSKV